jgi:hypothetical protein
MSRVGGTPPYSLVALHGDAGEPSNPLSLLTPKGQLGDPKIPLRSTRTAVVMIVGDDREQPAR